jgi:hypothetical protein
MKIILRILLFIVLIIPIQIKASPLMGGEVYYRYLGGLTYEITFRVFRDCRGVSLDTSLRAEMLGVSGSNNLTKKLSLTLISITDLGIVCKKANQPCSPPNTAISGTYPAVEEHIYKDTVDFHVTDTAFKKCCLIKFGFGQCCRPTGTLYGGGKNFWVWSELDICSAKNNNSPIFSSLPNNILCCNQEYKYSLGGMDTLDFDSISYSYADPMENWSKSILYPTANNWISAYFPSGWDKTKSNPNTDPPIGIYFDKWDGTIAVTPVGCPEKTFVSFKISEWRKDSAGKYNKIGEVRRDIQYIVQSCNGNNSPKITNNVSSYSVCAGTQICFDITTQDRPFVPPPPAKTPPPDTITLSWNKGISKGATFNIIDTTKREKTGRFCWTPKESDVQEKPYTFTVSAKDDHCPMNGIADRTFSIKVKSVNKTEMLIKDVDDNTKALESKLIKPYPANPKYLWQVTDLANNAFNIEYYFFKSTKSITSNSALDTLIFRKKGTYIVKHTFNNSVSSCPIIFLDTLIIPEIMDVSISKTYDTLVCPGTTLSFKANITNGVAPYIYVWGNTKPDTKDRFSTTIKKDTVLSIIVIDSKGKTAYSWCNIELIKPFNLESVPDKWICKNDSTLLSTTASEYGDTCYWQWYFGGQLISDKIAIKVNKAGNYIVKVTDGRKCFSKSDTINVSTLLVSVDAGINKEMCFGQSVNLKAIATSVNGTKTLEWYKIKEMKVDSFLIQKDSVSISPQLTSNYLVKFIATSGGTNCIAYDTVNVKVKFFPTLSLSTNEISRCLRDSINTISNSYGVNKKGGQWFTDNDSNQYLKWPQGTDINLDENLKFPLLNYRGGKYLLKYSYDSNGCKSSIFAKLKIEATTQFGYYKIIEGDSVTLYDDSYLYIGREWYINSVFFNTAMSIKISIEDAKTKEIKLRHFYGACSIEDILYPFTSTINSLISNEDVMIYPNPFKGKLNIHVAKAGNYNLKIFNETGQLVLQKTIKGNLSNSILLNQVKGSYIIEILDEVGGHIIKKVILE